MDELQKDRLASAKRGVTRMGKHDLIKHLNGTRLTQRRAIYAKCYDCNGMGEDDTCIDTACSLYPYSQFSKKAGKAPAKGGSKKKGAIKEGVKCKKATSAESSSEKTTQK